jgi:hypothetical protein
MTVQRQQFPIDLKPIFEALEKPLALVEDPERRRQYEAFLANSRTHQERAILNLLSNLAADVTEATGSRTRLELQGDENFFTIEQESEDATPLFEDDEVERVTIRMPKELKKLIDQAAERTGHSTNTWYVRTLARSIARHLQMDHLRNAGMHGRGPEFGPEHGWRWRGRGRRRSGGDSAD